MGKNINQKNLFSHKEEKWIQFIPNSTKFSPKDFVENIIYILKDQITITEKIDFLYKQASQLAIDMENFYIKEQKRLEQNKTKIADWKINLEEIYFILDIFGYERNNLEEKFLNIEQELEIAIDKIRDDEDRNNLLDKLDNFKDLVYKIYNTTTYIYQYYEYLARELNK